MRVMSSSVGAWQTWSMKRDVPNYRGYRFPPEIISHAVWLYHRFGVSFRDVEDLLAQRGLTVSYEAIRLWCSSSVRHTLAGSSVDRAGWATLGTWTRSSSPSRDRGTISGAPSIKMATSSIDSSSRIATAGLPHAFSQAVEGPRASARAIGHRHAEQLQGCAPSGHAVRRPSHGPIREQPRRGFASTDATTRATDAPVQIRCARAAISLGPRTRAESLPSRATSTTVGAPPLAPKTGVRRMGCGDVCLLNDEGYRAIEGSSRPPLINLTVSIIPLPAEVAR